MKTSIIKKTVVTLAIMSIGISIGCTGHLHAETVTYTYDANGRLLVADYGGGKSFTYTYDKAGNILTETITVPSFTLQVSVSPAGGGSVSGGGIDCPSQCSKDIEENQPVTLTASAQTGYKFLGWGGNLSGMTNPNPFTMDGPKSVTAYFGSDKTIDLVTNYYNGILNRPPESGGAEWWTGEVERIAPLGINPMEGFIAVGKAFFNSNEYRLLGKTDTAYILDLYQTFLNRVPSQNEIDFFLNYMAQGVSRNEVLNNFIFSQEYRAYIEGIFGVSTPRPENILVNDFYRGILSRLPDTVGYNYWLGQIRAAQCAGSAQQIRDLSYQIAMGFIQSNEYTGLGRTDGQFIEDLYDAILRRGAAPWEVSYWLGQLATKTREEVLAGFTGSTEFQTRVDAVIAAGCHP